MKRLYPIILLCLMSVNGCQPSTAYQQSKTQFFDTFSFYDTITKMNLPHIQCSGSFSTGVSGGGAGISSYRKDSSLACEIISSDFDEKAFTDKLRREIEREITNSGARLSGGGESGENFHCEYSEGSIRGAIEVVAGRAGANKYKLTYIIREFR